MSDEEQFWEYFDDPIGYDDIETGLSADERNELVSQEYDVCREEGHTMRIVYLEGEECEQCLVCGAIDC